MNGEEVRSRMMLTSKDVGVVERIKLKKYMIDT
jgi:hypothetical protein